MNERPRILLVRLSAIGDVLVSTPVTRAIRERYPDARVAWVVEAAAAPLLRANPYVDDVFVWNRRKGSADLLGLLRVARLLRAQRFDWAIDMQGLLRSAWLARLSGAREIVGNEAPRERVGCLYRHRIPRRTDDLSSRQRCLDLLRPLGIESTDRRMVVHVDEEAAARARTLLDAGGLHPEAPYACLAPFTTWPQKHWFEERWIELAQGLYRREGLTPVLLGGPDDVGRSGSIRTERLVSLVGRTSLIEAAAVLAGSRACFAVDTSLMHLAVAMGVPTVAVCGASWWHGFADYDRFALVREPLPCSPCLRSPICDGRIDCMRALDAGRVLAAWRALSRAGGARSV